MEFQQAVSKRRMYRNFEDRPVPPEALTRILENAIRAPSAGFSQGWAFLVLEGPEQTAHFWEASFPERREDFRWQGLFKAPVIIVPMSHKRAYLDRYAEPDKGWTDRDESRWPTSFWDTDTAFASMLILLTVVDCGLGSLFFGVTRKDEVRREFGVPGDYDPIGAIALGYPAPDEPSPSLRRGRRPLEEVVHRGGW
ncbi:MAG TPA: nitroreductase family protein [Actinomycetota bacterium]|nr:nitroreductase family protein [Actinomycetota bacterium]